jgi:hypothetical protein
MSYFLSSPVPLIITYSKACWGSNVVVAAFVLVLTGVSSVAMLSFLTMAVGWIETWGTTGGIPGRRSHSLSDRDMGIGLWWWHAREVLVVW